MPNQEHSPQRWGERVGGVSEGAGAKAGGSNLSATNIPSRVVTVKGIPVFWKAELFAGHRRKEGLGRSARLSGYLPEEAVAPMTADVRRAPRRGTSSAYAIKRRHPTQAREIDRLRSGDASFARSFDPCTSILTMLRARKSRRWGTGGSIAVGQTCASRRNRHRGCSGGRSAARRVPPLPQGRGRGMSEKEGGRGLRPSENREPGFGCPHIVKQLQKSVGEAWSRIRSANALQKERSGSSERGPSAGRRSAGDTVGRRVERRGDRESDSPRRRERIGRRPRVARDRHPAALTSPKAVGGVAGPGL